MPIYQNEREVETLS